MVVTLGAIHADQRSVAYCPCKPSTVHVGANSRTTLGPARRSTCQPYSIFHCSHCVTHSNCAELRAPRTIAGMGLNPRGRDWGQLVNWDDLGKFFAGFILFWTVILYTGVIWLALNRHLAFIKLRNLPLAVAAVSFLHVYLVKISLAYITNGHFTCSAEFWIMSIYLPFGIALFQASLVQLRSVFDQQQKYLRYTAESGYTGPSQRVHGLWNYWTSRPKVQKAYVWIGLGMSIQVRAIAIRNMLLIPLSSLSLVRCTRPLRPCKETGLVMGTFHMPKVRQSAENLSNGTLPSSVSNRL